MYYKEGKYIQILHLTRIPSDREHVKDDKKSERLLKTITDDHQGSSESIVLHFNANPNISYLRNSIEYTQITPIEENIKRITEAKIPLQEVE